MLSEILHTFLSEGRNRTEEFLAALEKGDVAAAEQKITALRGMAGNIRAEGVRVLAEMAEQACRRSRIDKGCRAGCGDHAGTLAGGAGRGAGLTASRMACVFIADHGKMSAWLLKL